MNADALRAQALGQELDWLQAWITAALEAYFQDAPLAGPTPPTTPILNCLAFCPDRSATA